MSVKKLQGLLVVDRVALYYYNIINVQGGFVLKRVKWSFALAVLLAALVLTSISCSKNNDNNNTDNTVAPDVSSSPEVQESVEEYATAEEYYNATSTVVSVEDVKQSKSLLSEKDAITLMRERGFAAYPTKYAYDMDGKYCGETEAVDTSDTQHPMYNTFYISGSGEVWTIYIINGDLIAYPASYMLESGSQIQILVAESDKLTSYDDETNNFYVTIPFESTAVIKTVDRIDTETLDRIIGKEL